MKKTAYTLEEHAKYAFIAIALLIVVVAVGVKVLSWAIPGIAESYLEVSKNQAVKNWQDKVAETPGCAEFKDRFEAVGKRYSSSANGAFANEMMKIWEETKKSGCAVP